MIVRLARSSLMAVITLLLAACGGSGMRVKSVPAPPAKAAPSSVDAAFDLLMAGDEAAARKQLNLIIKHDPNNARAQLLLDSMELDPVELLGPQSYSYTVRAGDTMSGLAQALLGNRLKAYQLLRYNKLKAPVQLRFGDIVRIPGTPPRPDPVRRPEPTAPRAAPVPSPQASKAKVAPAAPSAPSANPVAARQARAAGLAALNQGNVARAVGLLRRAAALDPGNALIARDLARAERIAATVRAKR